MAYFTVLFDMPKSGIIGYVLVSVLLWYGWYGMVWYGMVWCGVVWCGMVWYGMVWYDMV